MSDRFDSPEDAQAIESLLDATFAAPADEALPPVEDADDPPAAAEVPPDPGIAAEDAPEGDEGGDGETVEDEAPDWQAQAAELQRQYEALQAQTAQYQQQNLQYQQQQERFRQVAALVQQQQQEAQRKQLVERFFTELGNANLSEQDQWARARQFVDYMLQQGDARVAQQQAALTQWATQQQEQQAKANTVAYWAQQHGLDEADVADLWHHNDPLQMGQHAARIAAQKQREANFQRQLNELRQSQAAQARIASGVDRVGSGGPPSGGAPRRLEDARDDDDLIDIAIGA